MHFSNFNPVSYLFFFLKRESDRFFVSIAIRGFALGMITLFVPIYIYEQFGSLSFAFFFFAGVYGLKALLAPLGGHIMMRVGIKKAILLSHPFFWGFYISLLFFNISWLFVPLAMILYVLGLICFWPAYHTNFSRISKKRQLGEDLSRLNFVSAIPGILAPTVGGVIVLFYGYPTLFIVVLCVLFSSVIPMLLSPEVHQTYSDSYLQAYKRVFKKSNRGHNIAFSALGVEGAINAFVWPIFLNILAIGSFAIGGIATLALIVSMFFTLYMGRITDKMNRTKLLAIGSVLTVGAWIGKFFVISPSSAFLAQGFYRFARTSAGIPQQAILYEKAKDKGEEIDEFFIYRDIIIAISRFLVLAILGFIFFFIPEMNIKFVFLLAGMFSLCFVFLGEVSELKSWFRKIIKL